MYEALVSKGFSTEILSDQDPFSGTSPRNITNKTARRMGVQIEISKAQREAFLQLTREMNVKIRKPKNF
ncbi:poly-gamma-glutamate hydrolase family protein [Priestia megaterium]